jgi:hypothetical protein
MLGFLCLWLWPERGPSPLADARLARDPRCLQLAGGYLAGAALCLVTAIMAGGAALWLLWPAQSLVLVATVYAFLRPRAFQKAREGSMSIAARVLLWPYLVTARINAWLWTRGEPASIAIAPGVRLGHLPRRPPVEPKFTSPSDPAAQWTGANKGHAFFAYATNYLIDTDNAVIVDVEATRAIRQAEVGAARTMIDRMMDRFDLYPERLIADSAYGSAPMLDWLVEARGIEPHIPVFDKSARKDGTFERADFAYDHKADAYICPGGKALRQFHRSYKTPRSGIDAEGMMRYRARKADCDACALKPRCSPKEPQRKILRSIYEGARDMARDIAETADYEVSRKLRKKVEMLFAHLKRILRLGRLRLRGPCCQATRQTGPLALRYRGGGERHRS